MWILRWYLAKEVFLATLVVLITLLAVILLFLLIDEFSNLTADYDASTAVAFIMLKLPTWTVRTFPLALMIGAVFALGRLADQSELTIIRSSGISANKILFSVLLSGLIPIALMLMVAELVVPKSELNALNIYNNAHKNIGLQKTRYGIWLKNQNNFFHINNMHSIANMSDVKYYSYDKNILKEMIAAPNAMLDNEGYWFLHGPKILKFTQSGVEENSKNIISLKTDMSPELIQQTQIAPKIQSSADLVEQRGYLKKNLLDTSAVDYALWSRLSYPFVTMLMLFLAFPFVLGSSRFKSASQRMFIGIMVSLAFFILSRVVEQMGVLYYVPGWVTYFAPIILFFIFGLALYRRI